MNQIVDGLSEKCEITKKLAREIVEFVVDSIQKQIVEEEKVRITGLGTFTKKVKAARKARNPKTGEEVQVAEKTVIKFVPGKELKELVG